MKPPFRYYMGQLRQAWAKRHKPPHLYVDAVIAATRLPFDARILCVGARNRLEPDDWGRRGYQRPTAVDLLPSPGIQLGDMHRLAFPDQSFDLVYASHVLEHAWDLGRACREIQRVTAEGGYVFAACPVRFRPTTHDRWDVQDVAGLSALFPGPLWQVVWSHGGDTEAAALWRKCPWDKLVEADREARRWAANPLRLLCTVPPDP